MAPAHPPLSGLAATRRDILKASAATALVGVMPTSIPEATAQQPAQATALVPLRLAINGVQTELSVDTRTTLLDMLRERLGLTGTKKGCDHGQCGACTVLLNGRRVNACLTLAVMHEGDEIRTIEALASGNDLHPMQSAFIEQDGLQCGYCTPGQICSATAMLDEVKAGWPSSVTSDVAAPFAPAQLSAAEIRERMSGNLCRCAAYEGIVAAIQSAAGSDATFSATGSGRP
jgi:xanthine dehydrogenase YagT iron-sulfur-binding subunit